LLILRFSHFPFPHMAFWLYMLHWAAGMYVPL
jgi:hypothetical protein